MKIRFLADENFNHHIIKGLRRPYAGIDLLTSDLANLRGLPDPEILAAAHEFGRLLLTHDSRTIPAHFGEQLTKGGSSGVIIVSQWTGIGTAIHEIGTIWDRDDAGNRVDRLWRLS